MELVGAQIKDWRKTKGACSKTNPRSQEPEEWLPPWRYGWKRAGGSSELLEVDLGGGYAGAHTLISLQTVDLRAVHITVTCYILIF